MKVVSFFSGLGGLDKGFVDTGYDIIWANDFDKYAVQTYKANFGDHIVLGDINEIPLEEIPDCDILIGGFPCQPFRIAEIVDDKIKRGKKPKAIILENVRSLRTHNNGETYKEIYRILHDVLGYNVFCDILNSADYGVPQTRNRTYIVCFDNKNAKFEFPEKEKLIKTLQDLLEPEVDDKYFLSDRILPSILSDGTGGYKAKSEIDLKIARPLCATMAKMHRACQDNYVTQNGRVRRLTPRECARLQGFQDSFVIPVSDSQAYKQFGNAVTVNVSKAVAQSVKATLINLGEWKD